MFNDISFDISHLRGSDLVDTGIRPSMNILIESATGYPNVNYIDDVILTQNEP